MSAPTETAAPVVIEREGGVAVVRLQRPDAMNALDLAAKDALLAALREVADDPDVRCVVLTGTGRAFCVGQDLREHIGLLESNGEAMWTTVRKHYNPAVTLLAQMDKPVVAALNGVAAGAGLSLALAADFRVLADTAGVNTSFAGVALSCDTGASWTLQRLVGSARAKELLFIPRTVPAAECLELGLVTQVVGADDVMRTAMELAGRLAEGPTLAYGSIRRAVDYAASHDLAESLEHEAELMDRTGMSEDHRAAVDAFLAKEKPVFTGR